MSGVITIMLAFSLMTSFWIAIPHCLEVHYGCSAYVCVLGGVTLLSCYKDAYARCDFFSFFCLYWMLLYLHITMLLVLRALDATLHEAGI